MAQTTLNAAMFTKIVEVVKTKCQHLNIYNTICQATKVRQEAVRKLSHDVECLVVIGGKNSSNAKKLVDIAKEKNRHTFHIEKSSELNKARFFRQFKNCTSIGITAGASAPISEIRKAEKFFRKLNREGDAR